MKENEEREMHELARRLDALTRGTGWEAMRYFQIGAVMQQLAAYCAVCDCQKGGRLARPPEDLGG